MRNVLVLFLLILSIGCSSDDGKPKEENSKLLGKWKLIEELLDPGDGSGTFTPVTSDRVIEFFNDGTVTVNGILCYMSSDVGISSSGTYSEVIGNEFRDGEIVFKGCLSSNSEAETKILFKLEDGNLILWYFCIEPCGQKFKKLTD
ncbi:MBL fold metallo-hydrolase [Flavivirga eckloniae]|uniref:Lipocalin-like domain-containing protein n=1 Tax=Flavivirga eckloniae TaxID=1803846 RepID=A0A2K9PVA8_9FLAO|nr:hypothetical protein [Flavivirga eckloniae]AUP81000.1 hypothetical protein C1H87_20700 [Flavivirga eckloniae]